MQLLVHCSYYFHCYLLTYYYTSRKSRDYMGGYRTMCPMVLPVLHD
jgi:hypothetical protein